MSRPVITACLLLGLTLWAYQSTWSAGWVYEDGAVRTWATQSGGSWFSQRSLSAWTWRLTSTPTAAHALSLALHLLLGALVGVLAWQLGVPPLGAWTAMTIWLLHPMTVELAAYAKARADAIALVGILLAVIASSGRWWRGWGLTGIVVGTLIAIGGKQAGVVVFLLVPLTIWACRARHASRAPLWAPWWLPALVAAALIVGGVQWYGGLRTLVNADGEAGVALATDALWWQWLLAQSGAVWYWLVATVWPAWLTPDADIDALGSLARGAGLSALLAGGGAAWHFRTRAPLVSLGCAWVVCGVLPRLLIQTPRSYLSAAQFAVAFVGVVLLAGLSVQRLTDQWVSPS